MKFVQLTALACALSLGCNNGTDDPSDDTPPNDDTDTDIPETLITISGTAIDLQTQAPVAEGLCAAIIDPTPAVTGGDAITLAGGTVGASGAFSFDEIPTDAPFGLFASIGDCEGADATVWSSLTGILAPSYQNLNDGDTLDGVVAASVSLEMLAGIEASLTAAGSTEAAETAGAMIAWVRDADGNALAGGTVSCEGCGTFYYFDQDSSDGLFTSAAGLNAATDASGMVLLLAPPTSTYTAAAEGHEFDGLLFGGSAGVATFAEFVAK